MNRIPGRNRRARRIEDRARHDVMRAARTSARCAPSRIRREMPAPLGHGRAAQRRPAARDHTHRIAQVWASTQKKVWFAIWVSQKRRCGTGRGRSPTMRRSASRHQTARVGLVNPDAVAEAERDMGDRRQADHRQRVGIEAETIHSLPPRRSGPAAPAAERKQRLARSGFGGASSPPSSTARRCASVAHRRDHDIGLAGQTGRVSRSSAPAGGVVAALVERHRWPSFAASGRDQAPAQIASRSNGARRAVGRDHAARPAVRKTDVAHVGDADLAAEALRCSPSRTATRNGSVTWPSRAPYSRA